MGISPKHLKNKILNNSNKTPSNNENDDSTILIPGLPNHLAQLCLSTVKPSLISLVSRSWRRLIYSPSFPPFLTLYTILSPTKSIHSSTIEFFSLDPISSTWQRLPTPRWDPPLRLLHRHPSFVSRDFPIQSVSVSGKLVLVAATNDLFIPALAYPVVFDPLSGPGPDHWRLGPPLLAPRRWCAAGSVSGSVYVASGVGSRYQGDVARSLEKCDMDKNIKGWGWEKMTGLKDGRFSREAVEAVGYKGKLYMVNVKGSSIKQGIAYDVAEDRWEDMPEGMLAGWTGPAGSTDDDENMYVVDEKRGILSTYHHGKDEWRKVLDSCDYLKGAKQIAAGRGRVCVVCEHGRSIVVVDVAAVIPRFWVVGPPPEMEVVGLHILPRMCLQDQ